MAAAPTNDLPSFIKAFMDQPVWQGRTMRDWIHEALPKALDAKAAKYAYDCEECLKRLEYALENRKINNTDISSLRLADHSLENAWGRLKTIHAEYRRKSGQGNQFQQQQTAEALNAFSAVQSQKNDYDNIREAKAFLMDDLIPLLESMEAGTPPKIADRQTLNAIISEFVDKPLGKHGGLDTPGHPGEHDLFYVADIPSGIAPNLHPDRGTYEKIKSFFLELDRIVPKLPDKGERKGRGKE